MAAFNIMAHHSSTISFTLLNARKEVIVMKHFALVYRISINKVRLVPRDATTTILCILPPTCSEENKEIRLPFMGSSSTDLNHTFRPYNLSPTHYDSIFLSQSLVNLKDRIPKHGKSGVYRLDCNAGHSVYINGTGGSLITRIWEYIDAWASKK